MTQPASGVTTAVLAPAVTAVILVPEAPVAVAAVAPAVIAGRSRTAAWPARQDEAPMTQRGRTCWPGGHGALRGSRTTGAATTIPIAVVTGPAVSARQPTT
jgi:hypothetical protein